MMNDEKISHKLFVISISIMLSLVIFYSQQLIQTEIKLNDSNKSYILGIQNKSPAPFTCQVVNVNINDTTPPVIFSISYEYILLTDSITYIISSRIVDKGIGMSDVLLRYSTDEGETWKDLPAPMYLLGNGTYETMISEQPKQITVYFYIAAYDLYNNKVTSNITELKPPAPEQDITLQLAIIFIGAVIITFITGIKAYIKKKRRT